MPIRKLPAFMLVLIAVGAVCLSLSLDVATLKSSGYWSDEATYHAMAYSLAFDGDLRYEHRDLERIYRLGYSGGPTGVFLVREPALDRIHYAKAFAYPLFAAPFVRLWGDNGFLLLHSLLLAAMLAAGYAFLRRSTTPSLAALYTATYLLACVGPLYMLWLTPEWFNLSLAFLGTFLWIYKERPPGAGAINRLDSQALGGAWTDYVAAVIYGIVVFSKPPNIILTLPLILWPALKRRWFHAGALLTTMTLVVVSLFGLTWLAIGDWNYQGGDRKTFYRNYPFETSAISFESGGSPMITEVGDFADFLPDATSLAADLVYVWVGRNTGLLIYMFPAVLAVIAFTGRRRTRAERQPRFRWTPHGMLLAAWSLEILAILVVVNGNWIGGGGTVGSRYFLSAYALPFFAIPAGLGALGALVAWSIWALFLAQIVLNPFTSSRHPSLHTKSFPYTLLPVELTLLHNLPFNTNGRARLVELDKPATFFLYFPDNNTYLKEGDLGGFWVVGGREAEIVLRTREPITRLHLEVQNGARPNRVIARMDGQVIARPLTSGESLALELEAGRGLFYSGSFLYRFSVYSESGFVPRFAIDGNGDIRHLGLFVKPRTEPMVKFRP